MRLHILIYSFLIYSHLLTQITDNEIYRRHYPGPDGRGQEIGAEGDGAQWDEGLPEFGQQNVEGVAGWVGDAQDGGDELVLGGVTEDGPGGGGGGVEGEDGHKEEGRDEDARYWMPVAGDHRKVSAVRVLLIR